jgi:hypothetical protein
LRPYSPGGALIALATAPTGSLPPAPSAHRLRRGLPGYLILFAPHAFAPQRQNRPSGPPSPQVFFPISTHSTATPGIPPTSTGLQVGSFGSSPGVEPRDFTSDLHVPPARALRPVIPNNARALRLTAAAGTELAGASFGGTVNPRRYSHPGDSSPLTAVYTPKGVLPHAASLGQPCGHCPIFPTAASRRSLDRVSVPMWGVVLSDPLAVVALVRRYRTN